MAHCVPPGGIVTNDSPADAVILKPGRGIGPCMSREAFVLFRHFLHPDNSARSTVTISAELRDIVTSVWYKH
jgi:hypothetical protein